MPLVEICHLYISPGHNFFGHHGWEPDDYAAVEVSAIECVTGRRIRGDRFFDHKQDYKGQITFFALEVFDGLCAALKLSDCSPASFRRNIMTREADLNALNDRDFELQGVRFSGWRPTAPIPAMVE